MHEVGRKGEEEERNYKKQGGQQGKLGEMLKNIIHFLIMYSHVYDHNIIHIHNNVLWD